MKSFPSFCRLDGAQKQTLDPTTLYLASVGCPAKYLHLAKEEYLTAESYKIHPFCDLQVRHINETAETIKALAQFQSCVGLVGKRLEGTGTLTVINAYPDISEAYLLFWHFVAHFSHLKIKSAIKNKDASFAFIGNLRLEDENYAANRFASLGFGPALDEMNDYHVTNYVETIMRFDDLNLFLLTSTKDVTKLLERLRIIPAKVDNFFNVSSKLDAPKKPKKKRIEAV